MKGLLITLVKKSLLSVFFLTSFMLTASANVTLNTDTTKIAVDPTDYLDHFMCYDVEYDVMPMSIPVRVKDQFLMQGYKVLDLVALCAPAHKWHNNQEFRIKYDFAHLACYKVQPNLHPGANATVVINNQFQKEKKLAVRRVRTMCVPTLKRHLP